MASRVVGVSLRPSVLVALDRLAVREGESRSGMVARLVERAALNASGVVDVRVDGRRFVPEGKR